MKLRSILLLLIIVIMIPEILLFTYIVNKYTVKADLPQMYTDSFLGFVAFLVTNPFFIVIIAVVILVMAILHFALQAK